MLFRSVDEAADVAGVIGHDLCVGVEDVHSQNLGSGWQHRNVLNLKAKVQSIIFDQELCLEIQIDIPSAISILRLLGQSTETDHNHGDASEDETIPPHLVVW